VSGWRTGAGQALSLADVVCPDDPNATGGVCGLTYVVDVGYIQIQQARRSVAKPSVSRVYPITTLGIFRDYGGGVGVPDPPVSSSDVKSPSRTLMLSERPDTTATRLWCNSWDAPANRSAPTPSQPPRARGTLHRPPASGSSGPTAIRTPSPRPNIALAGICWSPRRWHHTRLCRVSAAAAIAPPERHRCHVLRWARGIDSDRRVVHCSQPSVQIRTEQSEREYFVRRAVDLQRPVEGFFYHENAKERKHERRANRQRTGRFSPFRSSRFS